MRKTLFITADTIGSISGGGVVCKNEYEALREFGEDFPNPVQLDSKQLGSNHPWGPDENALSLISNVIERDISLAHFYSGTFTKTIRKLKELNGLGIKISYTVAAHDIAVSKSEFESLGLSYDYKHLTDPELLKEYIGGYRLADVVIVPSKKAKEILVSQGCKNVVIIPHGVDIAEPLPLPEFTVGYLGQCGPDKGLRYLFEAWKKCDLRDSRLVLAGRGIENVYPLLRKFGGGNVEFMGYVDSIDELFSACSVYIQPSATEGFGIEVLEAMTRGRPVIVSDGAGASDIVGDGGFVVPARNSDAIVEKIMYLHKNKSLIQEMGLKAHEIAKNYSWPTVRERYQKTWRELYGRKALG